MKFAAPFLYVPSDGPDGPDLLEVLELEKLDRDLFRANFVMCHDRALYGGQVAAQALRAAGHTVSASRSPHSLHGYYIRAGNAERPTVFTVHRDRDGASYSSRRVEAVQDGKVIFNMAVSFHVDEDGRDEQRIEMPQVASPDDGELLGLASLLSFDGRAVEQSSSTVWPTRFWSRATVDVGDDPLLNACALTYLSDISSGITPLNGESNDVGPSLDHSVWFHRPIRTAQWVLLDLVPQVVSRGRGFYSGTVYDESGTLVASIAQECVVRVPRRGLGMPVGSVPSSPRSTK